MKYILSLLLIIFNLSNSSNANEKYDCNKISKFYETQWSIDDANFLDEGTFFKNKTKFKDINFKRIWINNTPLFGLQISFKNRFHNMCFDNRTFPLGILAEEIDDNLVFFVITNIGRNIIYSVGFNLKKINENPKLSFLSETDENPHYKWFVDKLTLKDAIKFHKSIGYEEWIQLYWRGKWYNIEWNENDYN